MAGLDYGSSFRMKEQPKEGVSFAPRSGKWIVRVKKKTPPTGTIVTLKGFDKKGDADKFYKKNK